MKEIKSRERGFTLSEVIITLVVLGIVAAITVPMMSSNAHDKKWNVARQKAQATIGEAFRLMTVNGEISTTNPDGTPRTTEYMVTKILPKYLKLAKTCDIAKATECGMSTASNFYKRPDNVKVTLPTTWTTSTYAAVWKSSPTRADYWNASNMTTYNSDGHMNSHIFQTLDGFSVNFFYNPKCLSDKQEKYTFYFSNGLYVQQSMDIVCFMGVYDMNGKKGPNKVGMDVGFIGSFYNNYGTKTVAVLPYPTDKKIGTLKGANEYCKNLDKDNNWKLPNINETSLLYLNLKLLSGSTSLDKWYWSSTPEKDMIRTVHFETNGGGNIGASYSNAPSTQISWLHARCIRNNTLK